MRLFPAVVFTTLLAAALPAPAHAQREAIAPTLSPEMAAEAFEDAVTNACVPAVLSSAGWEGLAPAVRGRLEASSDAAARKQVGAADDETVLNVKAARGVVFVRQKPGRCTVSVYGPPAMPTILALAGVLAGPPHGFEKLMQAPPPNGFGQSLLKVENGRRVMVQLRGSEPGMPGHQSRFSVVTATVFAMPAG
jgi:hypothetical protein